MTNIHSCGIVILDFGSQYTQLIARRVREQHVYSIILPPDTSAESIMSHEPKGIIFSGGPSSIYDQEAPRVDPAIYDLNIPILGICYGLHLLVEKYNGQVEHTGHGEYGLARIVRKSDSRILEGVPDSSQVWMSHGDQVTELPDDWTVYAESSNGIIAALGNERTGHYATQFHPEVSHTTHGEKIISNFLFRIARCNPTWTPGNFINEQVETIRNQTDGKKVLVGVSGGVDSSVVAALISRAIGDRSVAILIDHGLMRKDESENAVKALRDGLNINIHAFDESKRFLDRLKGVTDPEEKRKRIGNQFIRSFEQISNRLGEFHFLGQGTLYPDVIESGHSHWGGKSAVIKTHHNVGGLPESMDFELMEPLRELFKDEVRNVGRELGLPEFLISRHPFPGPGLAVRIIGEVTGERLDILKDADEIFMNILHEDGIYDEIWQAFSVLIPVKSVGVMGDKRTYENLLALRAVTSTDGMTADWYKMPSETLSKISNRIVNRVKGINRVVYDVTSKPPGTIEWE